MFGLHEQHKLQAKALYDNISESPDELAFRRGDIITVLEQETGGLDGWWLCSLRGKQGIVPGNRLKIIHHVVVNHAKAHIEDTVTQLSREEADQHWNRRSWDGSFNKVVMPGQHGNMLHNDKLYERQPDYDVPPTKYPNTAGSDINKPTNSNRSSREDLLAASAPSFEQSLCTTTSQSSSFQSAYLSFYDTPPSHFNLDSCETASGSVRTSLSSKISDELMSLCSGMSNSMSNPTSMCDSARSSMDISPMDMYDVPPSQKEHEAREAQTVLYPVTSRSSKDSGLDMYDSPPKMKSLPSLVDEYDTPRQMVQNNEKEQYLKSRTISHSEPTSPGDFLEDYDVPKSRSPFAQNLMFQNRKTNSSLLDLEEYDVPNKNPEPIVRKPPIATKTQPIISNSLGSLLDDYDIPRSSIPKGLTKDDHFTQIQSSGTSSSNDMSNDKNPYDNSDPANVEARFQNTTKPKLQKQEHAVDDLYDSPRNNTPVKNMTKEFSSLSITSKQEPLGVYDIPPQVTRDSVISSRSDSSDGNDNGSYRLSTCSMDCKVDDSIPIYDELPLDLDSANDLVIKLQQDVQKTVNQFSTFVHSSWRKKGNLEKKLCDIKQSCIDIERTLGEFVEFGQGTLANSAKLSDRKLINKLSKYLIPLQQALQQIRVCIKHLNDSDWQVMKLVAADTSKKDDLGIIASVTKDLIGDVRKLTSFIQGNSSLLFKRAKDFKNRSKVSENLNQSTSSLDKTPVSQKPAVPAKVLALGTPVQSRPLPAPPPTERPLPPTPTDKKVQRFNSSGSEVKHLSSDITSKHNSGEFKHWSGEFQVKRLSLDKSSEKCNSAYKNEDLTQDYDYVELDEDQKNDENNMSPSKIGENMTSKREKSHSNEILIENKEKCKDVYDIYIKVSDLYEKELEKTLDEIDGVNVYSDDPRCIAKQDFKETCTTAETENNTGTLKRKNVNNSEPESVNKPDSNTLKSTEKVDDSINEQKTTVNENSEKFEIPEHDSELVKQFSLDSEEKQVLAFYSEQLDTHSMLLTNAIDAFINCIENNEAPKVFISHSKFVVVTAHKLVFIGDSLHKNLKNEILRNQIIESANYLCDCLKLTVNATKTAALQYPSVSAIKDMIDKIIAISGAAKSFKMLVVQSSKL